ncbi:MAG: D-2-hydroxyacid dehydrogenase, partial [Phycisphaerae bacterium]
MKIVVLDGYTLNPGDLSWASLESLGDCEVHDRSLPEEVVPRAAGAEIVVVNKIDMSREVIGRLAGLRYIGVTATGHNIVDVAAAGERDIIVTNVPTYGTRSVAQMVFAHLLNLAQRVAHHADTVRRGRWSRCPDFCYWDHPLIELAGLTMGIVGLGRIGRATAELAAAFGMDVLAFDVRDDAAASAPEGVELVELDDLFRRSDVVTLHCPLTDETLGLVDARRLGLMKATAFLINTARGPLVDADALAEALNAGRIAGAGLDVLPVEPPPAGEDSPALLTAKNCFITPHIAWATRSARRRLMDAAVENVRAFLE